MESSTVNVIYSETHNPGRYQENISVYILCPRCYSMRHEQTLLYSFLSELPRIQVVQICSLPTLVALALYHVQ